MKGYYDALDSAHIAHSSCYERTVRSLKENVDALFTELEFLDDIDGIFCPTDDLAALCIPALQAHGKNVPDDIAIIGFDDATISQHTSPPLSTVKRPVDQQAHAAIDLLLKILNKEIPYEPGFHEIETDLVIRDSTNPNR